MKKYLLILMLTCIGSIRTFAQANEAAQLALNIEKLAQLKSILTSLKRGYEIVTTGYGTIKNLTQGNFSLHKIFLDGLMQVNPAIKKYWKVPEIINYQLLLVKEYKTAFNRFKASNLFNENEIIYLGNVYGNLFKSSLKNLDELLNVITANQLRMSDDERLNAIDGIYAEMEDKLNFLRVFNNDNAILAFQREKAAAQLNTSAVINDVNLK